jgi:uncharacterized protein (TIGR03790 family)
MMNLNHFTQFIIGLTLTAVISTLYGQKPLYKIVQTDTLGNIEQTTYKESLQNEPENVLVLYNINYTEDENDNNLWDGYEIAEYYRLKRNIPNENVVAIKAPPTPDITRAQYDSSYDPDGKILGIRQQIENILNTIRDDNGILLRNKIKYIVLTKGIPHRIRSYKSVEYTYADYSSVDAAVALVFNEDLDITWRQVNPYFNQDQKLEGTAPFVPGFFKNSRNTYLSYLVTRLDGYSVADVKAMIDRSVSTNNQDRYKTFIIDGHEKPYDSMFLAYFRLKYIDALTFPDPFTDTQDHIFDYPDSIMGIVGHGVHSGLPSDYILEQFSFKLGNGAIFSSYESFNGASFSPARQFGQGQVSDFISIGGSGGVGNVYEPYASGIADEAILFPMYYLGYTFAEAAWMSLPYIDWASIIVGDPLMRIAPEIEPYTGSKFWVLNTSPRFFAMENSATTVAEIIFSSEIDTTRLPYFYYQPDKKKLEVFVDKNQLYLWYKGDFPGSTWIKFNSSSPIYSVEGDSLQLTNITFFRTFSLVHDDINPKVYSATPSGIEARQDDDIYIFFSQKMQPQTIYPVLGDPTVEQQHFWIDDRILKISHPPLLPGTKYSFYIDEHAKSVENYGLEENFYFNFETEFNFIAFDIDNDNQLEFVHNLNGTMLDGYETFEDPGGANSTVLESIDLDGDNQNEFFLSVNDDFFPSYFWDPNLIPFTGYIAGFTPFDDDEDGGLEYAFDCMGTGKLDKVYDPNGFPRVRDINFVLYHHLPEDQQTNVSLRPNIVLNFTKAVPLQDILGRISINPEATISTIHTGSSGRQLILHFKDSLSTTTEYSIKIDRELSSDDDDILPHDYNFSFTTGDIEPFEAPVVTEFYPGDSLYISNNTPTVRIIFSLAMDTGIINPVITDTTQGIFWSVFWADKQTLYLVPASELENNVQYTFSMSSELKSANGISLTGKTNFNFFAGSNEHDRRKPELLFVSPTPGSVIRGDSKIVLIYSEWINSEPQNWFHPENDQHFSWVSTGQNMFEFSGNPAWFPQKELQIHIDKENVLDNNQNELIQSYAFNYFVLSQIVKRDIDNDGIMEIAIDANLDPDDGLEVYLDPGGIQTYVLFTGNIDLDNYCDFVITDGSDEVLLSWYPARSDSGLIGYSEMLPDSVIEVSIDEDDLVEYRVLLQSGAVEPVTPRLRYYFPENASTDVPKFKPVELYFNTRMDPMSVAQYVDISPMVSGKWLQDVTNSQFVFYPENGWEISIIYEIVLNPGYRAANNITGEESCDFTFKVSDNIDPVAQISWHYPQSGDTLHSQSDYFFAFTEPVDTSFYPEINIIQNFTTNPTSLTWISNTLLKVTSPPGLSRGTCVLKGSGDIYFLNTQAIAFDPDILFHIRDEIQLKFIRSITDFRENIPVISEFPFIFNQPLTYASIAENVYLDRSSDNIQLQKSIELLGNYLKVIPEKMNYSTEYCLQLDENLKGISDSSLVNDTSFVFLTQSEITLDSRILNWLQTENYIILSWPVDILEPHFFELYITSDRAIEPDTLNYTNLFSKTHVPSWVLDLSQFSQRSILNVRLVLDDRTMWAKSLAMFNHSTKSGDLLSLPVARSFSTGDVHDFQSNLQAISQWDESIPGWKSSKYLDREEKWNSDITFDAHKGILAKGNVDGAFGWLQTLDDSISIISNSTADLCYRSFYSPFDNIYASELAKIFGDGKKLAIWDSEYQAWNEAVCDTVQNIWVNNFQISLLTPFYILTANDFSMNISGNHLVNQNIKYNFADMSEEILDFPSKSKIFHFSENVERLEFLCNDLDMGYIPGCGIDTTSNSVFINLGNMDQSDNWKVKIWGKYDKLLLLFETGHESNEDNLVPESFSFDNPYPNPFNPTVNFPINIPAAGKLDLKIYNVLGQVVYSDKISLSNSQKFIYRWHSTVSSGVYFVSAKFQNKTSIKKIVLIK